MVRFELVKKLAKKLTENEILVNMVSNGYLMDEKKLKQSFMKVECKISKLV